MFLNRKLVFFKNYILEFYQLLAALEGLEESPQNSRTDSRVKNKIHQNVQFSKEHSIYIYFF